MVRPPRSLALALALSIPAGAFAQTAGAPTFTPSAQASGQGAALSKALLAGGGTPAAAGATPAQLTAARQAGVQIAGVLDPRLPQEIATLEKQINSLFKNARAVETAAKPVLQSGVKIVDTLETYPAQVQSFKTRYGIPADPTLKQEIDGIGRYLGDRLGVTPEQAGKVARYAKTSPIYEQLKTPFQPANIMLAVGATAGINLIGQMSSGDGMDLGAALGFLGQGSFWGGMVGSSVGYGLAAAVTTALIPAGAGLLPVLAPMFVGLAGSMFGWEIGAGVAEGRSLADSLKALDPASVLGQAAGSTAGLLVGAHVGAMLGGTLGSLAGPLGAVAGAVLLGQVGAQVGTAVKRLFTQGDAGELNAALDRTGKVIKDLENAGKAISQVKLPELSLPAASMTSEGFAEKIKTEYDATYEELRQALVEDDKSKAFLKLAYLQKLSAEYQRAVGRSLQSLGAHR